MIEPAPVGVSFRIRGPIVPSDFPALSERVCKGLAARLALVVCDVAGVGPDVVTVDALARLQLVARRHDREVRLRNADNELLTLVAFMGLANVLPELESTDERPGSSQSQKQTQRRQGGSMTATPTRKLFVNLAVGDLERSVKFFTDLGFAFNPQFTDEQATCMIVSDEAFVMLLTKPRFADFTTKDLSDPSTSTEAILALSAESREEVDALADKALATGGASASDPMDYGFMYGRSFYDPDGHLWEVIWMDPSALARSE